MTLLTTEQAKRLFPTDTESFTFSFHCICGERIFGIGDKPRFCSDVVCPYCSTIGEIKNFTLRQ